MFDINVIIAAYEQCSFNQDQSCDGCPYDGECASRLQALDIDVLEVLKAYRELYSGGSQQKHGS